MRKPGDDGEILSADTVWATLRFRCVLEEQDGSGLVVLRSGGYAAALAIYPPNYAMLSEAAIEELLDTVLRPALNKLAFPFAVFVRARRPNIAPWLEQRRSRRTKEPVEILRRMGLELDTTISTELRNRDIVEREMAVVIPYTPIGQEEASERLQVTRAGKGRRGAGAEEGQTGVVPAEVLRELASRCDEVADMLRRVSCYVTRMGALALLQWLYEVYNPDRAPKQPLTQQSVVGLMAPVVTLAQARLEEENDAAR